MKIAVIGAGITGLTAAYYLSQKKHQVFIFEKEKYYGGLAAGFKKKGWGWNLENFYHHLFTSDTEAQKLIADLSLNNRLFYSRPKTSIFSRGRVLQLDSPFSLLSFSCLPFSEKIRVGLITAYLKFISDWQELEGVSAIRWLKKNYGQKSFEVLWQPLLEGKFGKEAEKVSMAWFWARAKKRSTKLGYLKGGFQALIDRLVKKIKENGGKFYLKTAVAKITSDGGRLSLRSHDSSEVNGFDKIIITVPTEKFFPKKLPKMLGAINLILVLKEKFLKDDTYWLNINDISFPFVAVVEHTNFIEPKYYGGNHLVYVGGYYPQNHRFFKMSKSQIFKEFFPYLKKINPKFSELRITNYELRINLFAQPVISINYSKIIPKMKTKIPNVYLANMQMVYPWDRGINYAIGLGEKVADEVSKTS